MTCEDAHLYMHDYISGELGSEECSSLMDHLDECPNCRRFFNQTQQMQSTVRSALHQQAPTDLQNAVHNILANA
ncbi:MAG: zf-HC2 domain-containing protein [Candidatus Aegiribacteria sp.]